MGCTDECIFPAHVGLTDVYGLERQCFRDWGIEQQRRRVRPQQRCRVDGRWRSGRPRCRTRCVDCSPAGDSGIYDWRHSAASRSTWRPAVLLVVLAFLRHRYWTLTLTSLTNCHEHLIAFWTLLLYIYSDDTYKYERSGRLRSSDSVFTLPPHTPTEWPFGLS